MPHLLTANTEINDAVLNAIAHIPTKGLASVVENGLFTKMTDADFMRIATFLAQKGYDEGGCPIGGVIINNETRQILGKGHNTLVQENHPYNHGETSAVRDAGRQNFKLTTIFTTLTPCNICTALVEERGFSRVVIGDVTNTGQGNIERLRSKNIQVDVLEDPMTVALYKKFREENPDLEMEDWKGIAAIKPSP